MTQRGEPAALRRAHRGAALVPSALVPSVLAPTTLTPIQLPDGLLEMRSPRLSDGPAWSAARLANREWLERAFPAWGDDWVAEQSEVAWAQRWARLRSAAVAGRAMPFVVTLDGSLIGEIGVDAVDETTGTGELSIWRVRSRGAEALPTAVLLVIEHIFAGDRPLARMIAPVATSNRRGLSARLTSLGLQTEAILPRKVGRKGLVDHDVWVVHNTTEVRRRTTAALDLLRAVRPDVAGSLQPAGGLVAERGSRGAQAAVVARAAVREARSATRLVQPLVERRRPVAPRYLQTGDGRSVILRSATRRDLAAIVTTQTVPRGSTSWAVEREGDVLAVISHRHDAGSATTEVSAVLRPDADLSAVAAGAAALLDDLRPDDGAQLLLVVRVPSRAPRGTTMSDDLLISLGLERVATFLGNPDGQHGWGGENVWRVPADTR